MSAAEQTKFITDVLAMPVGEDIAAMAAYVRNLFGPGAVAGILAYGSCLRGVSTKASLVDFYVLVHKPEHISTNSFSSMACQILPPNVYYAETEFEGEKVRTKFAVLDIETFARCLGKKTRNPYFWARFAQPSALIWTANESTKTQIVSCIETGIATMMGHCLSANDRERMWEQTLVQTYRTELRVEGPSRAKQIVERNKDYYRRAGDLFSNVEPIASNWALARVQGKMLSVLRLIKASFTFAGAADYLAWKISRHSGVEVTLKPWQRRHPILAAIYLLPGLLKKGAVR